jgi:Ca2+-binding RTX toxin-like protein
VTFDVDAGPQPGPDRDRRSTLIRRSDAVIAWEAYAYPTLATGTCGGATVGNTDVVDVVGADPLSFERLELSGGQYSFVQSGIEFRVAMGADRIDLLLAFGSAVADTITIGRDGVELDTVGTVVRSTALSPWTDGHRVYVDGDGGHDSIRATGSPVVGPSPAFGVSLWGRGGNDTLTGGDGADDIHGGTNNDTIDGGAGADVLDGEQQNDVLRAADGEADLHIAGRTGTDVAYVDAGLDPAPVDVETIN